MDHNLNEQLFYNKDILHKTFWLVSLSLLFYSDFLVEMFYNQYPVCVVYGTA